MKKFFVFLIFLAFLFLLGYGIGTLGVALGFGPFGGFVIWVIIISIIYFWANKSKKKGEENAEKPERSKEAAGGHTSHIGFFGPSRIGKTTLLAAMVEEFKSCSDTILRTDNQYLKLSSAEKITSQKLSERINNLKAGIQAGKFLVGTLAGTAEHETFKLRFEEGQSNAFAQDFILHDFPGGWLDDPAKKNDLDYTNWNVCILPIDATIVMECGSANKGKARNLLAIEQVENFLRDWAASRRTVQSLCVLCPVKAETYFSTPQIAPALRDKSNELHTRIVDDFYAEILELLAKYDNINVLYMPVNTIGCCYLQKSTWEAGGMSCEFAITPLPGKNHWAPHGPVNVLFEICHFMAQPLMYIPEKEQGEEIKHFLRAKDMFSHALKGLGYTRKKIIQ